MKQQLFVIIGAIVVLFFVLVWAYLLFFGTPEAAKDIFTDLDLNGEEDTSIIPPPVIVEEQPAAQTVKPKLRQLTTKLVAGYREIVDEKNNPFMYYVEKGTGHIYSINMLSGEEVRLSGTTVQNTYQAAISPKGDYVAIASLGNSKTMPLILRGISTSSDSELISTDFKKNVRSFAISDNNELLYAEPVEDTLNGYSYNLNTKINKSVFTLPFLEAEVKWSKEGLAGSQYIYPKPSYGLDGFLYEATKNKLVRLPVDGFGLSAIANKDIVLYNSTIDNKTVSTVFNRATGKKSPLASVVVPEKCFLPETGYIIICGNELVNLPYEFPDSWYRGEISFKDTIYAISGTELVYEKLVDTLEESGREIDAILMQAGSIKEDIYFINKNDNSLWVYEI
jgi:hypothetical protein